jgi:hypothetical protein
MYSGVAMSLLIISVYALNQVALTVRPSMKSNEDDQYRSTIDKIYKSLGINLDYSRLNKDGCVHVFTHLRDPI